MRVYANRTQALIDTTTPHYDMRILSTANKNTTVKDGDYELDHYVEVEDAVNLTLAAVAV